METRYLIWVQSSKKARERIAATGRVPTGGDRGQDVYRRGNVNTRINLATTIFQAYDLLAHRIPHAFL